LFAAAYICTTFQYNQFCALVAFSTQPEFKPKVMSIYLLFYPVLILTYFIIKYLEFAADLRWQTGELGFIYVF